MDHVHDAAGLRAALSEIAADFSFTWTPGARSLFQQLAPERFPQLHHNPIALLSELTDDDLSRALDVEFAQRLARVQEALAIEAERPTWWHEQELPEDFLVAYFSAEFGLDQSLPIYSGGLGILAGDHLKAASELGVPLVGIGLYYRRGYFRQRLDEDDRQVERYPRNDTERLPLTLVPMCPVVELEHEGRLVPVRIGVWRARVGRISLYLLDTKVEGNPDWARAVTDVLYGGDRANRLRQELVLGIGGVRVLRLLGLAPTVFHMNEGHSAFLQLERLRELVQEQGVERHDALETLRRSTVFTTHTPVPAGNEVFDAELVRRSVEPLVQASGFSWEEFAALGRFQGDDTRFGMTPFALWTSDFANGVSQLHGEVSREMWQPIWPDKPASEVPITSITNAVHARSWISDELEDLLGHTDLDFSRARELPDEVLWEAHLGAKRRMLAFIERTRGIGAELSPDALTLGFARRFATYKRAGLLFRQPERLSALLDDPARPLQLLVAGKAHPADEGGKALIQQVVDYARSPSAEGRIHFLPDYEISLARRLVQGVDVWLNTPRRPMEASGTSGMKAALNGVLNCSILDGWWAEAYAPELGWAIGDGEPAASDEEQDAADCEALFRLLEEEIVPAYYDRDDQGLPRRWIAMMRVSIAELGERFNTTRMVCEYVERLYLPAHAGAKDLSSSRA
ncbi:MAG TPA: alpha-glucan family phosphorylase [Gaiellaceae bacterium]|nr:alpha-glucan family phosphorylase [Gaiellaceae bacterium]